MLEFQNGGKSAFEALMQNYYSRVLNFIYRFVGSKESAEDLTQEVFLRVYKYGPRYKPKSKFQTWLYTIAKNISLNELRRNRDFTASVDEPATTGNEDVQKQIADPQGSATDQELILKERAMVIRQAINELPENQRLAVILRRYDNFSYAEIAKTIGVSDKAVKALLSRARINLRRRLSRLLDS
ncbi:MAG: RNA polymerase sigma factor [Deltaproteobacteria bacterium]|nr:RNA polymerase sigma factor [Deltaproteobacteria bacterium]